MTDQELMERFSRKGDTGAYEELVRRWDRRVLSFLYKSCGDYEAAKDIRQEVFLRVFRYGAGFRPEFAFTTWLFRIASNTMNTWKRKEMNRSHGVRRLELLAPPSEGRENPESAAERAEAGARLRDALDALSENERQLLLLRFDLGMSYREISEVLETPETTLKSRLYTLLGRLKADLREREQTMPRSMPQ